MPPLRDRRDDVPLLAHHFLRAAAERQGRRLEGIESAAMDALVQFGWPGNVRELQNEVQRMIALADPGRSIEPRDLSPEIRAA